MGKDIVDDHNYSTVDPGSLVAFTVCILEMSVTKNYMQILC